MKAIYLQRALALIFASLGGWCLLAPAFVESLIFKPEFYIGNSTSELLVACFGAQAVLGSVVMWWSIFRPATFLAFGILVCGVYGYRISRRELELNESRF